MTAGYFEPEVFLLISAIISRASCCVILRGDQNCPRSRMPFSMSVSWADVAGMSSLNKPSLLRSLRRAARLSSIAPTIMATTSPSPIASITMPTKIEVVFSAALRVGRAGSYFTCTVLPSTCKQASGVLTAVVPEYLVPSTSNAYPKLQ